MMTLETLRNAIEEMNNVTIDNTRITIEDFIGFDENWSEEYQDTDAEQLVDLLDGRCIKNGMYPQYILDDGNVITIEWTSYEI